ncbi:MAG: PTS sugar transporter subunit IIA, partial [Erysipelotrichaceae bacterium]|nr:PTS sugar transporter subunit IIA [Erysipelotrichaceae bacterium]
EQWIAVARLDKPILWRNQKVQLVFLINIREHHIVAWFMQKIAHLLAKENSSKELLQAGSFEEFLQEFRKL